MRMMSSRTRETPSVAWQVQHRLLCGGASEDPSAASPHHDAECALVRPPLSWPQSPPSRRPQMVWWPHRAAGVCTTSCQSEAAQARHQLVPPRRQRCPRHWPCLGLQQHCQGCRPLLAHRAGLESHCRWRPCRKIASAAIAASVALAAPGPHQPRCSPRRRRSCCRQYPCCSRRSRHSCRCPLSHHPCHPRCCRRTGSPPSPGASCRPSRPPPAGTRRTRRPSPSGRTRRARGTRGARRRGRQLPTPPQHAGTRGTTGTANLRLGLQRGPRSSSGMQRCTGPQARRRGEGNPHH
mmetsp:Transcript_80228/g.259825  ORF Transcript_80228/g.259825 Transcript_80228/m.259825 type:complete len:294 (-) Transcript_80228:400-1281(-)